MTEDLSEGCMMGILIERYEEEESSNSYGQL